jgi:hypothetical protein
VGSRPALLNYKKAAFDSQWQVIKLPMVGGSLRVLRLLPPLKLVALIYSESGVKHNQSINHISMILIYIITSDKE